MALLCELLFCSTSLCRGIDLSADVLSKSRGRGRVMIVGAWRQSFKVCPTSVHVPLFNKADASTDPPSDPELPTHEAPPPCLLTLPCCSYLNAFAEARALRSRAARKIIHCEVSGAREGAAVSHTSAAFHVSGACCSDIVAGWRRD